MARKQKEYTLRKKDKNFACSFVNTSNFPFHGITNIETSECLELPHDYDYDCVRGMYHPVWTLNLWEPELLLYVL